MATLIINQTIRMEVVDRDAILVAWSLDRYGGASKYATCFIRSQCGVVVEWGDGRHPTLVRYRGRKH